MFRRTIIHSMALAMGIVNFIVLTPSLGRPGHGIEELLNAIPAERVKQLMDAGEKILLVDLRSTKEFQERRIPGSRSLPLMDFDRRSAEVPRSGRVVLYCDCLLYQLAEKATGLENQGYKNVGVMLEGFSGWVKLGFPVEPSR